MDTQAEYYLEDVGDSGGGGSSPSDADTVAGDSGPSGESGPNDKTVSGDSSDDETIQETPLVGGDSGAGGTAKQEDPDTAVARLAVERGFVTTHQVEQCRTVQGQLKALGITKTLGEVLVERGYMTAIQAGRLKREVEAGDKTVEIGGFRLTGRLGRGGMGTVYRARQISLDRDVALKILPKNLAADRSYITRFIQEARLAARLHHPNIVQAIDVGTDRGFYYFAMELVEGASLGSILRDKGPLSIADAVALTAQIAHALEHAWERAHLIHRDVKPDNILIDLDRRAKLADLGLAKVSTSTSDVTTSGAVIGTPNYISPEQARGERHVDGRSDIYSLGCTLYHMLTGSKPYDAENSAGVLMAHISQPVCDPRQLAPDLPGRLADYMMKMMAKNPGHRPQSCAEVATFMERFREECLPESAQPTLIRADDESEETAAGTSAARSAAQPARPWLLRRRAFHFVWLPLIIVLEAAAIALWLRGPWRSEAPGPAIARGSRPGVTRPAEPEPAVPTPPVKPPAEPAPATPAPGPEPVTPSPTEPDPAPTTPPPVEPADPATLTPKVTTPPALPTPGPKPVTPTTPTPPTTPEPGTPTPTTPEPVTPPKPPAEPAPTTEPKPGETALPPKPPPPIEPPNPEPEPPTPVTPVEPVAPKVTPGTEPVPTVVTPVPEPVPTVVTPVPEPKVPPVTPEPRPELAIRDVGAPTLTLSEAQRACARRTGLPLMREIEMGGGARMRFVLVPPGEFVMGSRDGVEDEQPTRKVRISRPFYLAQTETTNGQFRRFRGTHRSGAFKGNSLDGDTQPAVGVSWNDARGFAGWLSEKTRARLRLPTEAEWEYACRAGTASKYYWGDEVADMARHANLADRSAQRLWQEGTVAELDDSFAVTAPVGRLQPNAFGLADMLGNVWEWCADYYDDRAYRRGATVDPTGPADGDLRVFRGGSWFNVPSLIRSAVRGGDRPDQTSNRCGFRLVLEPPRS
jgi:serine/threonine-protein kinase